MPDQRGLIRAHTQLEVSIMYLRCTQVAFGPGPSDVIIRVDTEDGWEEIIVHRDILKNERVDVGFPIAKRNGSILIELPRESVSGRNRVWVSTESVNEEDVAA